jgi:hypothetical protein
MMNEIQLNRLTELSSTVYSHIKNVKGWSVELRATKPPFSLLQVHCEEEPRSGKRSDENNSIVEIAWVVPVRMQDDWTLETYEIYIASIL